MKVTIIAYGCVLSCHGYITCGPVRGSSTVGDGEMLLPSKRPWVARPPATDPSILPGRGGTAFVGPPIDKRSRYAFPRASYIERTSLAFGFMNKRVRYYSEGSERCSKLVVHVKPFSSSYDDLLKASDTAIGVSQGVDICSIQVPSVLIFVECSRDLQGCSHCCCIGVK